MNSIVRIFVFHRNRLFRECLAQVLSQSFHYQAQPAEHEAGKLAQLLSGATADIVFIDLNLPDNATQQLVEEFSKKREAKVILLVPVVLDDHDALVECIAAGAHACVLEGCTLDELRPAVDNVLGGHTYCSTDIVQALYAQLAKLAREVNWRKQVSTAKLTTRETEVLELMSERLSNKQIAKRLKVSLYTVKNHVHSILEKLQAETRLDAVQDARERRLIDLP